MNPMISMMIVLMIGVSALVIVMNFGKPSIDTAKIFVRIKEAESSLKLIDNYLREVSAEGLGASRTVSINIDTEFRATAADDSMQFKIDSISGIFDYLSRKTDGNMVYISGNDVDCSDTGNFTMENSFLKAVLQKVSKATPMTAIDTTRNIINITEKTNNNVINFMNSSIIIDNNATTINGTGYSELSAVGSNLPLCQAHFFINSTVSYDVYYTLYAGADFLVAEIRNVM